MLIFPLFLLPSTAKILTTPPLRVEVVKITEQGEDQQVADKSKQIKRRERIWIRYKMKI